MSAKESLRHLNATQDRVTSGNSTQEHRLYQFTKEQIIKLNIFRAFFEANHDYLNFPNPAESRLQKLREAVIKLIEQCESDPQNTYDFVVKVRAQMHSSVKNLFDMYCEQDLANWKKSATGGFYHQLRTSKNDSNGKAIQMDRNGKVVGGYLDGYAVPARAYTTKSWQGSSLEGAINTLHDQALEENNNFKKRPEVASVESSPVLNTTDQTPVDNADFKRIVTTENYGALTIVFPSGLTFAETEVTYQSDKSYYGIVNYLSRKVPPLRFNNILIDKNSYAYAYSKIYPKLSSAKTVEELELAMIAGNLILARVITNYDQISSYTIIQAREKLKQQKITSGGKKVFSYISFDVESMLISEDPTNYYRDPVIIKRNAAIMQFSRSSERTRKPNLGHFFSNLKQSIRYRLAPKITFKNTWPNSPNRPENQSAQTAQQPNLNLNPKSSSMD